jgi:hypothetical protein
VEVWGFKHPKTHQDLRPRLDRWWSTTVHPADAARSELLTPIAHQKVDYCSYRLGLCDGPKLARGVVEKCLSPWRKCRCRVPHSSSRRDGCSSTPSGSAVDTRLYAPLSPLSADSCKRCFRLEDCCPLLSSKDEASEAVNDIRSSCVHAASDPRPRTIRHCENVQMSDSTDRKCGTNNDKVR